MDITNLVAVLTYLAGPAGVLAWFVYVSNWFRNAVEKGIVTLDGWRLQLLVAAVSFLPPVLAFVILAVVPTETLEKFSPYYQFVATLCLAYLGQQAWFAVTKPKTSTTVQVSVPAGLPATAETVAQPSQAVQVNVGPTATGAG